MSQGEVEAAGRKMQEFITTFTQKIERETMLPEMKRMHECIASCIGKHMDAPRDTLSACASECGAKHQHMTQIMQQASATLQERVQMDSKRCMDEARMGMAGKEGGEEAAKASYFRCELSSAEATQGWLKDTWVPSIERQLASVAPPTSSSSSSGGGWFGK